MYVESVLLLLLFVSTVAVFAAVSRPGRIVAYRSRRQTWNYVLGFALMSIVVGWLRFQVFERQTIGREQVVDSVLVKVPHLQRRGGYVSSHRCQACHPGEHASWHQSFHRTMTQLALPENVTGEFDDTTVYSNGLAYRMFRDGERFFCEMPDPDEVMMIVEFGKPKPLSEVPRVTRQIVMTTGSHHYQTYWVPGNEDFGKVLQTVPVVYLIAERQWIPREAAFMTADGAKGMVTQWNHHCIRCHSTGGIPGLSSDGRRLDTSVGELGISCEACHGPGESHVKKHQDIFERYKAHLDGQPDNTIVNPARLDHRASTQVCGQCHGVYRASNEREGFKYAREGSTYRPGRDLHATRYYIQYPREGDPESRFLEWQKNPTFFRERWWNDGTILAGGREYTALEASACYRQGTISCLSCHSMHDSDPADQLIRDVGPSHSCTQCHDEPRFTTAIENHTHHVADSSGSSCVNCHMPHTTYALFSAIRSHQIVSPNIRRSVDHGVPNACNLCHLDQTLSWTQDHLSQWYGQEEVTLTDEQAGTSAFLLWLLKGDAAQRAIAAWHSGWPEAQAASGKGWLAPFVAHLLNDPYGVVRHVAQHSLRTLPGFAELREDFLADAQERAQAVVRVVEHWNSPASRHFRGQDMLPTGPFHTQAVLLHDDGT
ncbi:MAG: hypothetical protein KDA99_12740, partial [Planctomycetales bacterium]|nr:hypothetical protein [Planctomycetales bacterium]